MEKRGRNNCIWIFIGGNGEESWDVNFRYLAVDVFGDGEGGRNGMVLKEFWRDRRKGWWKRGICGGLR